MAELYSLHRLRLHAPGSELYAAIAAAVEGLGRRQAREAIIAGLVTLDGTIERLPKRLLAEKPLSAQVDLRQGINKLRQAQKHSGAAAGTPLRPFTVLYQDADILVVDKAPGVLSAPSRATDRGHVPELLRTHARHQGRDLRHIGVVHRLDLDTSGCLCFAMSAQSQRIIAAQFAGEAAERIYRCLVVGGPRQDADTLESKIGRSKFTGLRSVVDDGEPGKTAISHFRVLHRFGRGSELEVRLGTGRTHQIRVHLVSIGCPVFGDRVYAKNWRPPPGAPLPKPPRLMLHAHILELDHPRTGQRLRVEAPMPGAFADFAAQLG